MDQQYGYQQPAYQPPYSPPTNTLAIISLIASILGLVQILPVIGPIGGLIMGYIAKRQIAESRGAMGGDGLAKAGIIIGWIGVAIIILGICIAVAYFLVVGLVMGGSVCALMGNTY